MSGLPWVSVSSSITYKNKPKSQPGLCSARYAIAQKEAVPLKIVLYLAVKSIVEFYVDSTDLSTDEINEQIRAAVVYLQGCEVKVEAHP